MFLPFFFLSCVVFMRKTRKWQSPWEVDSLTVCVSLHKEKATVVLSLSPISCSHSSPALPLSVSLIILLILLSDSHTHIQDSTFSALGPSLLPTFIQPERESRDWAGSMVDFIIKRLLLFYGQGKLKRFLSAVWESWYSSFVCTALPGMGCWFWFFFFFFYLQDKTNCCVFSWEIMMYSVHYGELTYFKLPSDNKML